jgi:signal transduction histidine kinase
VLSDPGRVGMVPTDRPSSENWEERISAISWLCASMVHDLRNPLGTVLACTEMLLDSVRADDPAALQTKRLAGNIYRAALRMRELLTDVAGAGCESRSASEICRIRDVIRTATDLVLVAAERQGVRILNEVPGGVEIPLRRSRIERVFFNLLSNALEAMPHGGSVRMTLTKVDKCVLITVEDTGPGIPDEIRRRLFEPFVTAGKKDGLGLGLALSLQTIRDHGGDMWTEPARGARFVMRLPLKEDSEPLQGNPSPARKHAPERLLAIRRSLTERGGRESAVSARAGV